MSAVLTGLAAALVVVGVAFFAAGSAGVLRFPDVYTRLHAVTKADNVGLGFVVLALAVTAPGPLEAIKLFAIWILILVASSTGSHLIARTARRAGAEPWRAP